MNNNHPRLSIRLFSNLSVKSFLLILLLTVSAGTEVYAQKLPFGKLKDVIPSKSSAQEKQKPAEPTVFPGAVQSEKGQTTYYTDSSYAEVRAYYEREAGAPESEEISAQSGQKSAFFEYVDYKVHKGGVRIEELNGYSNAVDRVLKKINNYISGGYLTKADYDRIHNKYSYLHNFYYKSGIDDEIYQKYDRRLSGEGAHDVMEEAQKLMMSGRQQEAIALMQKTTQETQKLAELKNSPAIIDEWVKCLDEIAAQTGNSWNIRITVQGM